jgi:hypothetical protein
MRTNNRYLILKPGHFHVHAIIVFFILFFIIGIFSASCSPSLLFSPNATNTLHPTGTRVVLPPTWTEIPPTETDTPTFTPSPTPSPTITPTDTGTLSNSPTLDQTGEDQIEPSATLDWSTSRDLDCTFTATKSGVRIFSSPFIDPYHILPTMEPGKPYQASLTKPTYTLLLEDGQPLGWIDYRWLSVTHEGNDCLVQQDTREITDFKSLCFFSPLTEISGYSDSSFEEALHTLNPSISMVVLNQREDTYFTSYGSSGPSFVVKKEEVYLHGNCDNIPTLAESVVETSLYTLPPDQGGSVIYSLAVGEPIFIQSKTQNGSPPPGVEGSGYWILARRHSWSEDINGWVWSAHIVYK